MHTRGRFAATFAFQPVDRPLFDFQSEPAPIESLCRHFGVASLDDVLDELHVDLRYLRPDYMGREFQETADGGQQDVWGVVRKPVPNPTGVYMEPVHLPWAEMRTVEQVEAYPWPQAEHYDFSRFPELCDKYRDAVILFGRDGLMDLINGVAFGRGVEQVLMDIATRDEVGLALFRKRFEFMYDFARRGLEAGQGRIDMLLFGEDLGTQNGLVISPGTWEELFRPYMKRMIDLAHEHGAKAMMHSCGSVAELIPRFIELGLDALHAVQPQAAGMAPEELVKRFGGKIVFDGTMDIQATLPFGTTEDVRSEVRHRKRVFADCGGFILGPCHHFQTDTPVENIVALYDEGGLVK